MDTNPQHRWIAHAGKFAAGLALALLLPAAETAAEDSAASSEAWYQVEISGQAAGWLMEREGRRGEDVTTESKMHLEIRRGDARVSLGVESTFVESLEGRPISARTVQKLGAVPIESTYEFRDDGVLVRKRQDSGPQEELVPWPEGEWLTPVEVRSRLRQEIAGGATEISIRSLDLLLGLEPVTTEWVLEQRAQDVLTVLGTYNTSRWRQTQSYAPRVESRVFVDGEGQLVRSETSLMGLAMTVTLAERESVLDRPTATPELLVRSFIRPDRQIERPRHAKRAVYEVRSADGDRPELPSVGVQRFEAGPSRVVVELGSSPEVEVDRRTYLRSTTYLPHEDPRIRELRDQALASLSEKASQVERAEELRSFVTGYVVGKDLNTVLATAAEVAATRSGDCTEHSVLLAALLRAADIPSRVVSGVVYVKRFAGENEIFGYHMWTQALVGQRWHDLDATLPGASFDAAHIAMGTSALTSDQSALREMARILPLMGQLEIRVLEVEYP